MEQAGRCKSAVKVPPLVQEIHQSIGSLLNDVDAPALLVDALSTDCPVVGAAPAFCSLTGYSLENMLGQNCRMMLRGVPDWAISKSARKNIGNFCKMCRVKGLTHIAEVSSVQANARQDGAYFTNFFMLGLCRIGPHVLILGIALKLNDGLSVQLPPESVMESSRNIFKSVRARLLSSQPAQIISIPSESEDATFSETNRMFRRQVSTWPAFAFYAERLQDHCLLIDSGHTAVRREPEEVPKNCLVFGDRPLPLSAEGFSFSVKVNEVTPRFQGFPFLGFTKRRPQDLPDLYPGISRCCGSSVLIGGCGEAFARDQCNHFRLRFKQPSSEEIQQWAADPSVPAHMRKPHVDVEAGDVLQCTYFRNGHLKLERNGETMWDFDLERPIDESADYYAVADICLSVYSLTVLPPNTVDAVVEHPGGFILEKVRKLEDAAYGTCEATSCSTELPHQSCQDDEGSESEHSECADPVSLSVKINEVLVKQCIQSAVKECRFMVTIADPRGDDCPLIAVSPEFEALTGYQRSEILGSNCRFLNHGCNMDPALLIELRKSSDTGMPFTGVIPNRKKSGELFWNLLDLRGLSVGTHPETGEDLWFLIGVQGDVTNVVDDTVPDSWQTELQVVANAIRSSIAVELSRMAVGAADTLPEGHASKPGMWNLLKEPMWMTWRTHQVEEHKMSTSIVAKPDVEAKLWTAFSSSFLFLGLAAFGVSAMLVGLKRSKV
jgi:PAS domain-containing protein